MMSTISLQGGAKWNHFEISSQPINSYGSRCWWGSREERTLGHPEWKGRRWSHYGSQWEGFPKRLKQNYPVTLFYPCWVYTWRTPWQWQLRVCVHCCPSYNNKEVESTCMCTSGWMGNEHGVHVQSRVLSSIKEKETMKFVGKWVQLELLSEVTQDQKDQVCMVSIVCRS